MSSITTDERDMCTNAAQALRHAQIPVIANLKRSLNQLRVAKGQEMLQKSEFPVAETGI
jgi:hypothetical protein